MSPRRGMLVLEQHPDDNRRRRPLGRPFQLLWAGQSLSLVGDQISLIAFPLVATRSLGAGTLSIGALGACLRLPFLVFGLPAGVWVARAGLLRSMLAADLLRGVAVALVPVLIVGFGIHDIGTLFAAALSLGVGTVFFQVAYQSVVPELVDNETDWHPANTRLSLSESTALFAGPAVGGLVIGAFTAAGALAVDAATYGGSVASLLAVLLLARRRPAASPTAPPRDQLSLRAQIGEGIRYVRRDKVLNALMWTGAAYNLGAAMYDTLIVIFAVHTLHMSTTELGVVIGLGAVGFPVGSLLSKYANVHFGLGRSLMWAAVPSVGGLLVGGLAGGAHPEILLGAGTLLVGLGQGCFAVNAITLRQRNSEPHMRARASAVHRFLSWGALPLGSVAAGLVGAQCGVRVAMIASGFVAASCFLPLLHSPLRRS